MDTGFGTVQASCSPDEFARIVSEQSGLSLFLVENHGEVIGVATREAAIGGRGKIKKAIVLGDLADKDYVTIAEGATLLTVMDKMRSRHASFALVTLGASPVSVDEVRGLITKQMIGQAMMEETEMFCD